MKTGILMARRRRLQNSPDRSLHCGRRLAFRGGLSRGLNRLVKAHQKYSAPILAGQSALQFHC